jgi:hypothetical protein
VELSKEADGNDASISPQIARMNHHHMLVAFTTSRKIIAVISIWRYNHMSFVRDSNFKPCYELIYDQVMEIQAGLRLGFRSGELSDLDDCDCLRLLSWLNTFNHADTSKWQCMHVDVR